MSELVTPEVIRSQLKKAREAAGLTKRFVSESLQLPEERIDS